LYQQWHAETGERGDIKKALREKFLGGEEAQNFLFIF